MNLKDEFGEIEIKLKTGEKIVVIADLYRSNWLTNVFVAGYEYFDVDAEKKVTEITFYCKLNNLLYFRDL